MAKNEQERQRSQNVDTTTLSPTLDLVIDKFVRFTNPDVMRDLLQCCLPISWLGNRTIVGCTITDSRFKTYRKETSWHKSMLAVCYELRMVDPCKLGTVVEIFYAKVYIQGRGQHEWERLKQRQDVRNSRSQSVAYLPALDMIVWRFPADPVLSHLWELFDPALVAAYLPSAYRSLDGQHDENVHSEYIMAPSAKALKYRPEVRCTARVDLQTTSLVAKSFCGDEGATVYSRMLYFWEQAHAEPGSIAVPQPLGYVPEIKTLWLAYVEGDSLQNVISGTNCGQYLAKVALGLTTIHQSNFAKLDVITISDLLEEFIKKTGKLSRACPLYADQLEALAHTMQTRADHLSPAPHRVIHGDFHIDQLLVQGKDVVILDFCGLAWGDPEQDLAEFIVALHFYGFTQEMVRLIAGTLIDAYNSSVDWQIEMARLRWHAHYEYVNRLYRHYQEQRPGWMNQLHDCLSNVQIVDRLLPILGLAD